MLRTIVSGAALALTLAGLAGCAHHPKHVSRAGSLYKRANASLKVGGWKDATQKLRQLISTYPFGKYATQARLDLIYTYYRSNEADEAARQADAFARQNPASPYVPYALFMKGVAYANAMQPGPLDSWFHVSLRRRVPRDQQQAYTAFTQLIKRYPHTPYAHQARQWMVFVRDRLAGYNLEVARFYARRNEWVAAVDRASTILTKFPTTPSVKPALKIMIRGYKALGEKTLAAHAKAWYQQNFAPEARTDNAAGTAQAKHGD